MVHKDALGKEGDDMRKINGTKLCYTLSALLVLGFIINTVMDYSRYNSTLNSAPFSLWIAVNALYFILPAMIAFVIGIVIKKKACDD